MRSYNVLLLFVLLACCAPQRSPNEPPPQQKPADALASYGPTMDSLKENPLPKPHMPGCYDVILPKGGGDEYMPDRLELTATSKAAPHPLRAFRVRSPMSREHSDRS